MKFTLVFILVILLHNCEVKSSTIVDNPGSLKVVGSLSPLQDTFLGYQPPLNALLVSARQLLFGPPRLYIATSDLASLNPVVTSESPSKLTTQPYSADLTTQANRDITSTTPYTQVPEISVTTRPPQFPTIRPALPRRIPAQSPAASEANFPSSQTQTGGESRNSGKANVNDDTVEQIQAYSKPVAIPASGRALFSRMNVADGSYHFGYDTGSGQHQSYREERRFPGGRVEGRYGYVDPEGVLRIVEYTADQRGYRSRITTRNLSMASVPIIGPIPAPLIAKARSNASSR